MKQLDHAEACEQDEERRLWMAQEQTLHRLAASEGTIADLTRSTRETYRRLTDTSTVSVSAEREILRTRSLLQEKVLSVIPDARIANLSGNTAGVQYDSNRRVVFGGNLVSHAVQTGDGELLNRVAKHERAHQLQETGDISVTLSSAVSARLGGIRILRYLAFREYVAMKAEGGVHAHTSQEYIDKYWNPVERVRSALNQQGADGNRLVMEAGRTHAGFTRLVYALHQQNPALN